MSVAFRERASDSMFSFISYQDGKEVINTNVYCEDLEIDDTKTQITIKRPAETLTDEQYADSQDIVDFVILEDGIGCQPGERDMDYQSVLEKITKLAEIASSNTSFPLTNKDFHEAMKK